jgi:hypothetical protein
LILLEALQETDIVGVKITDIGDAVFQHRDTLKTDTEGETGIFLGIETVDLEDMRMDHAAAQDLDPAGTLAYRTALAAADMA